ncbi:30S ribosomal protein S14 [Candidatus Nardonella dryophthoridicola]|uniref:30S ribosomal protein S14 n=1 Tax=Candidatus Nardonella dryophthoridicola TaxID=1971485 RepID=UPI001AD89C4A|nr:30S ribosomal protein S14 [Candidatus Nardonella dryophthoridicola]QTJ62858.1 30S ribosomal protein S14 [Candidatus Nardonella dryophthoridicola]
MTKKSLIERNNKRKLLINKYYIKRKKLNFIIKSNKFSSLDKWKANIKLQLLPKDSSIVRLRNRCYITGRPRGFIRYFGLSRIKFRELSLLGNIPGIKKSSW